MDARLGSEKTSASRAEIPMLCRLRDVDPDEQIHAERSPTVRVQEEMPQLLATWERVERRRSRRALLCVQRCAPIVCLREDQRDLRAAIP